MNDIENYLTQKGITFRVSNNELITKCIFSNCDSDSRENEAHLYFSKHTGQYQCKKCGATGNLITLKKHFGDANEKQDEIKRNRRKVTPIMVEKYHEALPEKIRQYLNSRGISGEMISKYKLGYASFYGNNWITIPIKDIDGNYAFFKLRQDPEYGNQKMTWPSGIEAQIFDWESLLMAQNSLLVVEGEGDALLMQSLGISAISGTHGAETVKEAWMEYFKPEVEYFICYDNDEAGRNGSLKMAKALLKHGCENIKIITLPEEVGDKGDLGDYITRLGLPAEDLFTKYSKAYPEKIDVSKFKEIGQHEVCKILEATIKQDNSNKMITFYSMLTTYTEDAQMNLFFNAPSSTGKSHIPISVSELFPESDIITLAYCSPTAFFHDQGKYDKEKNEITVDLSKKILIFTDMPNQELISRLRPMLSHDKKESELKITDKGQKGGHRTKNIKLIGYPSVYFCSAGLRTDEQESTRFLMLSPDMENGKIYKGIRQAIMKLSNAEKFNEIVNSDPERKLLKKRILGIKQEGVFDVKIENTEYIEKLYLKENQTAKPRQQRDIKKIISIIKGSALLNVWFRKREGPYIWASDHDIEQAFSLWDTISAGQDHGLSPYVFRIYTDIIIPLWNESSKEFGEFSDSDDKKGHVTRKEVLKRHMKLYGYSLSLTYLKAHILPQLEQTGLIIQERSTNDKREMIIIPLEDELEIEENYSKSEGGVNTEIIDDELNYPPSKPLGPEELPF